MGTNPKVCSWVAWEGEVQMIFQGKKVGFFLIFQGIVFLVVWDGVVEERGWV
jgi:hypothetical protein